MHKNGSFLNSLLQGMKSGVDNLLSFNLTPSTYRGSDSLPFGNDFYFWGPNGEEVHFEYSGRQSALSAYEKCPPFAAIIEQKAQAFINGKTWVLNSRNREASGEIADKIRALLTQPNPIQNGSHFEAQVYINTYIFGFTVILPLKPFGIPVYEAKSLWAIPGNMIEVEEGKADFTKPGAKIIDRVWLTYKGTRSELPVEDLIIIKDFRPSFLSIVLPDPRSKVLTQPISNVIGALYSRGKLITQRGPRFLVSSAQKDTLGSIPLTDTEKNELQRQFAERYGLMRGQSQAIISNSNLTVTPVGFDVKQLGLFEEVAESSAMICIELGFPKFLAGLSDPTFNNQETAEKALYERFIIPDSLNIYGQLNAAFKTAQYNLKIEKDYTHLRVLQADKKLEAEARLTMNNALQIELRSDLIKINRYLELIGEDTIGAEGDVYWSEWSRARGISAAAPVSNEAGQQQQQQQQSTTENNNAGKNGKLIEQFKHLQFFPQ